MCGGELVHLLVPLSGNRVLGVGAVHKRHRALVEFDEPVAQRLLQHQEGVVVDQGEKLVAQHAVPEDRAQVVEALAGALRHRGASSNWATTCCWYSAESSGRIWTPMPMGVKISVRSSTWRSSSSDLMITTVPPMLKRAAQDTSGNEPAGRLDFTTWSRRGAPSGSTMASRAASGLMPTAVQVCCRHSGGRIAERPTARRQR